MNTLYNKILKEALDIMDFDSWDDNEQDFKGSIITNLTLDIFTYRLSGKEPRQFKILNNGWFVESRTAKKVVLIYGIKNWKRFPYDKFKDDIYIGGKKIEIVGASDSEYSDGNEHYIGFTKDKYPPGEYLVNIKNLDGLYITECLFFNCQDLIEVPELDFTNLIDSEAMFEYCKKLKSVPKTPTPNLKCWTGMFSECYMLDSKTKNDWGDFFHNH